MTRPVVLIESPYSGKGLEAIRYLACCLLDSVLRGEAPIASHAILPLCLPEHVESYGGKTGREIGLECRDAMAFLMRSVGYGADQIKCFRYLDIGISKSGAMNRAANYGPNRRLEGEAKRIWESGEWPSKTRWETTNE
jgi:hypothetical protein